VKARTMQDASAKEDTKYGTLIDHHIVGTTHQHIYNFRLDLDVDGEANSLTEMDPVVVPNTARAPAPCRPRSARWPPRSRRRRNSTRPRSGC